MSFNRNVSTIIYELIFQNSNYPQRILQRSSATYSTFHFERHSDQLNKGLNKVLYLILKTKLMNIINNKFPHNSNKYIQIRKMKLPIYILDNAYCFSMSIQRTCYPNSANEIAGVNVILIYLFMYTRDIVNIYDAIVQGGQRCPYNTCTIEKGS